MSVDTLREEIQVLAADVGIDPHIAGPSLWSVVSDVRTQLNAVRAELEGLVAEYGLVIQPGMPLSELAAAIRGAVAKPVLVTFVWDENDDYVYVEHNGERVWGESTFDRLGQYLATSAPDGYVLMGRRVDTVVAQEQAPGARG
jgi:hypothetical protein